MEIKHRHVIFTTFLNILFVTLGLFIWQLFQSHVPAGGVVGQTVTIELSDHNDNNHAKLIQSRHGVKDILKDITKNAQADRVDRAERELKKHQNTLHKAKPKPKPKPKPQAQPQKKVMEKNEKLSNDSKMQAKNKAIKLIKKVETKQKIESQPKIKPKLAQNQVKHFNKQSENHLLGKTHTHKGAQREGLGGESLLPPSYLQKLLIHLQKYKYYPPFALRRQITGEAKVNIRLTCQGQVESYQLVKKTGSRLLDNAVRQMLKQANPFPAAKVCQAAFNVVVPIEFKILAS
ncbi:energy transducer TonB [Piscirickettsia salmonis]|uniref:energy transducer TonB n=1 Tax=Piscirickettsia salmonis TaxID=1238 RepID=UPI0006BD8305|nr:TonB family protein [Piscirickettsia salmonis]ALA25105.1 protein TonB [Piscirickettsia salmonis]QGO80460.1 hypothetical protein Psal107_01468 [Piscirickettsia salmonis]QGP22332.1 hypothetical protein Psal158_01465 [Piscirickettsia salmonis]QGP25717.1 hypothetical protein Psal159_01467 [Piscirickettsia salmonis]QGP29105.1 hypothetical protein Psal160_01472 [Piscirickettsia salmonis]